MLAITPPYSEVAARGGASQAVCGAGGDGGDDRRTGSSIPVSANGSRRHAGRGVGSNSGSSAGQATCCADTSRVATSTPTVVALRSGGLVTFTALDVDHPQALVPILTAGLSGRSPAQFEEFAIPVRIGARADEQIAQRRCARRRHRVPRHPADGPTRGRGRLLAGAGPTSRSSRATIATGTASPPMSASASSTPSAGRVLVYPSKAFDGEWVSTFTSGTPLAIATAIERLTATLPDGAWFPQSQLTRDSLDQRTEEQQCRQTVN